MEPAKTAESVEKAGETLKAEVARIQELGSKNLFPTELSKV